MRPKLKQVGITLSLVFALTSAIVIVVLNFGSKHESMAAVNNDYRTISSGNWSNPAIWQRYNGSSWVAATVAPNNTHNVITIQTGHNVIFNTSLTVDQVVVQANAHLELQMGLTMTLNNGTGTELDVSGIFRNSGGTLTLLTGATVVFKPTGIYQHNYSLTPGAIPVATWNAGSTCEVIGYTDMTGTITGLSQNFHHFTWNCPNQLRDINLNSNVGSIAGNFTIISTGDYNICSAGAGRTLNVGGDYIQTGGTHIFVNNSNQIGTLNVGGNFDLSGGVFTVMAGSGSTGTVNVSGNFSHTGGRLEVKGNSATTATFVFNRAGTQQFSTSSNDVVSNIDFTVNSGSTLDMGESIMYGRNFTLLAGAGISIGSPDGIVPTGAVGNIQVTGTRTYNTSAHYTMSGNVPQTWNNSMPAAVSNLIINNPTGVTLNKNVNVSGSLIFIQGKLYTGSNLLHVTNNNVNSVTGNTLNNYVVGNLRRNVSSNGNYSFPVGADDVCQLISTNLTSVSGTTNITASFTKINPLEQSFPLTGLRDGTNELDSMLNYGFWTLTPNTQMTGGSHRITVSQSKFTNSVGGQTKFYVLTRTGQNTAWQLAGTNAASATAWNGSEATAVRNGLNSFNQYAIAYGNDVSFSNPSLISGVAGAVGATYLFPSVTSDIDAWMEIMELAGGATLSSIDDGSTGYNEAFQPFINIPGNSTASIQWRIRFKVSGTSRDTVIGKLQMTGIDVDGGSNIREFVEATMPTSYALGSPTILTVTNNNGNYRATSNTTTVSNIDTSARNAMFQLNYNNVNTILYRTGAINTSSSSQVRQTSLYFGSFLTGAIALPVSLTQFKAAMREDKAVIEWTTATEVENDYFTVERSADGERFTEITRKKGAGNSTTTKYYSVTDNSPLPGFSYYRLKQTDYDGKSTHSEVIRVRNNRAKISTTVDVQEIGPNPFSSTVSIGFTSESDAIIQMSIINSAGRMVEQQSVTAISGYNTHRVSGLDKLDRGIYFLILTYNEEKVVRKIVKQ